MTHGTVLHLELPRGLTATLRPPLDHARGALRAMGADLLDVDTNLDFWDLLLPRSMAALQRASGGVAFSGSAWSAWLVEAIAELEQATPKGIEPTFAGVAMHGEAAVSSAAIEAGYRQHACFFDAYATRVEARYGPFSRFDVVSLGITSTASLPFVIALGRRIRASGATAVLARHTYENFSLSTIWQHIDLRRLLSWVDAVVRYDEQLGEALARLVAHRTDSATTLANVARLEDGHVRQYAPASGKVRPVADPDYGARHAWPLDSLVCQTELVGNRCHYGRCAFCAQVAHHLGPRHYDEKSAIAHTVERMGALSKAGLRRFSFMDEALRRPDLQRLVDQLDGGGVHATWTGRTLAHRGLPEDAVRRLADSGCAELLMGVETVDLRLAQRMGKARVLHGGPSTAETIRRYVELGVDVTVSIIVGFIGEDERAMGKLRQFADGLRGTSGVSWIFNRFALFEGSQMMRAPHLHHITRVQPRLPSRDLQTRFDYIDDEGEDGLSREVPTRWIEATELGVTEERYAWLSEVFGARWLAGLRYLDYASFGQVHRQVNGGSIRGDVLESVATTLSDTRFIHVAREELVAHG